MTRRKKKLLARCYTPGFVYTPAVATNVAETFARIRKARELAEAEAREKTIELPIKRSVR